MKDSPTFIDLFAGAGGLSHGLLRAGLQCIYALEIDLWASQTFEANHRDAVMCRRDIRQVSDSEIRSLGLRDTDMVAGGPPCQGFSHSNVVNRDPHDPRNSLFIDFLRFVRIIQPKIALIENVPGLLTSVLDNGRPAIDSIVDEFKKLGYATHLQLLDACNFGVPQRRVRLFIVAYREDIKPLGPLLPEPTHATPSDTLELPSLFPNLPPAVTLWEAISDLPQVTTDNFPHPVKYASPPTNPYQKTLRQNAPPVITHHEPMRHSNRIVERFRHIRFGQSEEDVPDQLKPRRRGKPSELSEKSYSQNSRRQRPDRPCNTIVASAHTNYIHSFLHRNFTIRETMRIQSFPDNFVIKGKRAVLSRSLSLRKGYADDLYLDQRMQVGNAVPPLLAEAIGKHLRKVFPVVYDYAIASA